MERVDCDVGWEVVELSFIAFIMVGADDDGDGW